MTNSSQSEFLPDIICPKCGSTIEYDISDECPASTWKGYICDHCDYENIEWVVWGQSLDDMRAARRALEDVITNHDPRQIVDKEIEIGPLDVKFLDDDYWYHYERVAFYIKSYHAEYDDYTYDCMSSDKNDGKKGRITGEAIDDLNLSEVK